MQLRFRMLSIMSGVMLTLSLTACLTPGETQSISTSNLEVETRAGVLVGRQEEGVRRFLGIPFAAPPTGDFRFRGPRDPEPWAGRRAAVEFAPVCAQARVQAGAFEVEGDEDCLYLNVYTPSSGAGRSETTAGDAEIAENLRAGAKLPVLVWIHGGGRRVGNGRRDVAAFVRETGSIVVTIQYRLSHFAFFAHPALTAEDPARLASGNYGFEDAIAALRWIRDDISAFGGDAQRVTIGGLSGGGSMVCGLLASPEAAGLFQGAIIQSGSSCWFPTDPIEVAEARGRSNAAALGCGPDVAGGSDTGSAWAESEVAACLRSLPVPAFYEALGRMLDNPFREGSTESFAAMPMLGARSGHQVDGHVFPRSWPSAFRSGAFHRVPVMMGTTRHEGRLIYGQLLYDMGSHSFGEEDYRRALLGLAGSESMARAAAERFALDLEGAKGLSAAEQFADVATDAHYRCPLSEMALAIGGFTPTYFYEFDVPGPLESDRIELGAYHGSDTDLLFGDGFGRTLLPFGPRQKRAARSLRSYVAEFMRTGDPNGAGLPEWPSHDASTGALHLAFDDAPHVESGLRESVCEFWRGMGWDALP